MITPPNSFKCFAVAIGLSLALILFDPSRVNPQSSENPDEAPTQTVRVEQDDGIPWGVVGPALAAALTALITQLPNLQKGNLERMQSQASKEAEKAKMLDERTDTLFATFKAQIDNLQNELKSTRALEQEWRDREREFDNTIDRLKAENMNLRSEISVLHIENAKLRSKLGMDSIPPRIVADINLKNDGD